ncbi:MAG: hypothetical protein ACRCZB_02160 [Bacteroidales bacterium]
MKQILPIMLTMLFSLLIVLSISAQSRKDRKVLFGSNYNYEVSPVAIGQDGTKVFKVYGFAKKVDLAIVQAKKNAVAACIFRGIAGGNGVAATPAICPNNKIEEEHAEYFEKFFELGGRYLQYINNTTDGVPSGQDRLKIKGGYKIGITVQVLYDKLRKDLETDSIARRLDAGF